MACVTRPTYRRRMIRNLAIAATMITLVATGAPTANAAEPAPFFVASNGPSECWGPGHTATLWHFGVFNEGTKGGRYKVEYRRAPGDELTTYSRQVPKKQGVNDGLVIPAGQTIDYIRVSSKDQTTIFVRHGVSGSPRCSS